MIKKFNTVHELLQETLREFIYLERMNSIRPYAGVPYVCHVMKDCSTRSNTPHIVYLKTSGYIYDSMKGEGVYASYLRDTDPLFDELCKRKNLSYSNLLESQKVWREYLVNSKIQWMKDMIEECKANDY